MCKMLESLYNERCERLKAVMSSVSYAEVGSLYAYWNKTKSFIIYTDFCLSQAIYNISFYELI